ncbi:MAG: SpoIIE family protein phosphatase [Bacteroidetes bacterium]|nr:SpoIIE family protein phosphatase [Bacteroidota bacterium]
MKFRQHIILFTAITAFVLDFLYIVIQRVLTQQKGLHGDIVHTVLVLIALGTGGYYHFRATAEEERSPVQLIGRTVIVITVYLLIIGIVQLSAMTKFVVENGRVMPTSNATLVTAIILAACGAIVSIVVFASLTRLIFVKRRKTTRRNYIILLVTASVVIAGDFLTSPNGLGISGFDTLLDILYVFLVIAMVVNGFRFSWILVLSRREKIINLLLSLFGFLFFLILFIYGGENETLNFSLLYFHPALDSFVAVCFLFGTIYMGIGFASTLLHLPTAKEFDRKKVEISSLQNMSRLITQVFDFDELVATTTHLALEVSEGDAAWLELTERNGKSRHGARKQTAETGTPHTRPYAFRNIDPEAIDRLRTPEGMPLQHLVFDTASPLLIQDFQSDRRIAASGRELRNIGTLVIAPLISHGEIIGLLCVSKRKAFEFDKDVVNVLFAFADMVSVALENSALIRESIEKERMEQELLVAQQMQQSLLPQELPRSPQFEIAARSIPAYEVGGDYYDVLTLEGGRLGFVVGDVSGKGVSAALYMAQVKGIFQSLRSDGSSTRDILIRMNAPLCNSMESKSFISLLYAELQTESGELSFARAGHCPLLHVRGDNAKYLRPDGMALGLDATERFAVTLEEERIQLTRDDIIVMFSDGVTESRNADDEEYDYGRLTACVQRLQDRTAAQILDGILDEVRRHSGKEEADDDITVLVLRWHGNT